MTRLLKIASICVLIAMTAATTWASIHVPLWEIPKEIIGHPWFVTTLLDTYFAFLAVWAWIAWLERSVAARVGWLIAILLLGNFAIAAYLLLRLRRMPPDGSIDQFMTGRNIAGQPSNAS